MRKKGQVPFGARLEAALGQAEGTPSGGRISLRLYAELDERLPAGRRQAAFEHGIRPGMAVGEVAAELGVPAGEIDLALVDGRSVGLEHRLRGGERLSLFPVFESLDVGPVSAVRRRPLRRTRFVLDVHLGRLAGYLRLLGFDALYRNDLDDPELVEISLGERRLLLSRDRELLARSELTHAYRVRATAPRRQLAEVVERLDLTGSATPFTRCLACNGRLRPVPLEAVRERLPPRVRQRHRRFQLCPGCDRVLWRGSHYRRMRRWVAEVLGGGEPR